MQVSGELYQRRAKPRVPRGLELVLELGKDAWPHLHEAMERAAPSTGVPLTQVMLNQAHKLAHWRHFRSPARRRKGHYAATGRAPAEFTSARARAVWGVR